MKNSYENLHGDQCKLTVSDLEKRQFGDKYGNRSGIIMWGYHDKLKLSVVKRRIGNSEYYKDKNDFCSWTKVDLIEFSKAPFLNPSKDPQATAFKMFLENQVKRQFAKMKPINSFVRKDKDMLDPRTNEPIKIVMWPPTK